MYAALMESKSVCAQHNGCLDMLSSCAERTAPWRFMYAAVALLSVRIITCCFVNNGAKCWTTFNTVRSSIAFICMVTGERPNTAHYVKLACSSPARQRSICEH